MTWLEALHRHDTDPSPEQAHATLSAPLGRARAVLLSDAWHGGPADWGRLNARMDALAARLLHRALGGAPAFAPGTTLDTIAGHLEVLPRYTLLLQRYLAILCEEGLVRQDAGGAYAAAATGHVDCDTAAAELAREFPVVSSAVAMLVRCTAAAPDIINGSKPAIASLYLHGSLAELEGIYERLPTLRLGNAMLAAALDRICHDRTGRPVRILEVGAGTGALSAALMPALAFLPQVSYVYTDVDPLSLSHGREKFGRHPFVTTRILDICGDPQAQGLDAGQFDLVVAANVLHATPDLRRSLSNVRWLLREDGYLLTVETIRPSRFADCTVGLLDGWWSFTDPALRRDYPLISGAAWHHLLDEEGFDAAIAPVDAPPLNTSPELALVLAAVRR